MQVVTSDISRAYLSVGWMPLLAQVFWEQDGRPYVQTRPERNVGRRRLQRDHLETSVYASFYAYGLLQQLDLSLVNLQQFLG